MWDDSSSSDGGFDKTIELLITSDSELEMSWSDPLYLKILGSIASEFKDLSSKVLEDCRAINCSSSADTVFGVDVILQESMYPANRELI